MRCILVGYTPMGEHPGGIHPDLGHSNGLHPGGIHPAGTHPAGMQLGAGLFIGCIQAWLHPNGMYPDGCILIRLIPIWGYPKGCIPVGCILTGSSRWGGCPMELTPDGIHRRGAASCRDPSRTLCIPVGSVQPGFFPLYVRAWQTGGDVVLQDFSFPPQNAGCWPKPAREPPGSLPGPRSPQESFGSQGEPRRGDPKLHPALQSG